MACCLFLQSYNLNFNLKRRLSTVWKLPVGGKNISRVEVIECVYLSCLSKGSELEDLKELSGKGKTEIVGWHPLHEGNTMQKRWAEAENPWRGKGALSQAHKGRCQDCIPQWLQLLTAPHDTTSWSQYYLILRSDRRDAEVPRSHTYASNSPNCHF